MCLKNNIFVLLFFLTPMAKAQDMNIMTYNIKYDNVSDTINNWNDRKTAMVDQIKKYNPSFLGMQEVLFNQLEFLVESLPDYKYIGVGREDGKEKGEFSPILYNSKKYKLLQSNTFWLSKTPNKPSVGWDAALERICSYGLFEDVKTNKKLWVFNTHFDHIGDKARKRSALLILKKIKEINTEKLPIVLTGDFNLTPDKKPIAIIKHALKDSKDIAKIEADGPIGTFNGFNLSDPIMERIDYIFVDGFDVESYAQINERLSNGKYISDHLPVLITIK